MDLKLSGKVVVVVGGGSGIGRATAILCAQEGAKVIVADISSRGVSSVTEEIEGDVLGVEIDITNAASVKEAFSRTVERYGRIDGVANTAAVSENARGFLEADEADYERIFDVNVRGTWLVMQEALRVFTSQGGGGAIVNVASTAALRGLSHMAIYSASKHAVIGLTKSAAREYAKTGPRIVAVCPGAVRTPMLAGVTAVSAEAGAGFEARQPGGRIGEPEELAAACVWLLSDQASFITGVALPVDGGLTAGV